MSTYNIGFHEKTKLYFNYHQISSNTHLISSSDQRFRFPSVQCDVRTEMRRKTSLLKNEKLEMKPLNDKVGLETNHNLFKHKQILNMVFNTTPCEPLHKKTYMRMGTSALQMISPFVDCFLDTCSIVHVLLYI